MPRNAVFVGGMAVAKILDDKDWIRIIACLMSDRAAESRRLAERLLSTTKHGRQIRLLKYIMVSKPRFNDMQKIMKVSRRTIFRDLLDLESYGVKIIIDDDYRYNTDTIPDSLKRLL